MQELQAFPDQKTLSSIEKNLTEANPLLRRSALTALRQFDLRTQVIPIPISLYLNSPHPRLLQQEKEYMRTYWDWYYFGFSFVKGSNSCGTIGGN